MKADFEYEDRQIVPRFSTSNVSNRLIYTQCNKFHVDDTSNVYFLEKKQEWLNEPNILNAKELVSTAIMFDAGTDNDTKAAIEFINKHKDSSNKIIDTIIDLLVGSEKDSCCDTIIDSSNEELQRYYSIIHRLKKRLIEQPGDAFTWCDIAYYYTVLGQHKKAEKCIICALSLNNKNRTIVRSAARFYIHVGLIDQALYILSTSPMLKKDPWLLSAEIAISEINQRTSKNIKVATSITQTGTFRKSDTSELFATLSTLEYQSGNRKTGKRLLDASLESPNENTLAQAFYLHDQFDGDFNPDDYNTPYKFEVDAWSNYKKFNYIKALEESLNWFTYQPFSSRPAILYSYISSVIMNNNEKAIGLLNLALLASPQDGMLLNNKAFSLLQLNKLDEANTVLKQIRCTETDDDYPTFMATEGLYHIKKGDFATGTRQYEEAFEILGRRGDTSGQTSLLFFYYQAMKRVNVDKAAEILIKCKEYAQKYKIEEIINFINLGVGD